MSWLNYPITHGFYTAYDANIPDTPHFAYDIGTPFHTPITALLSGTVKQSDYAAWGGEIFVQPDDTSKPEYYIYHPDIVEVKAGQHVQAGQEIALSGGQVSGGTHPATGWSTGPHTHVGYFTNWISTPIGTRPQGPDIGPLLQDIKAGKIPSVGTTTTASPTATNPSWLDTVQSGLVRIGLFAISLIFIAFGFYMLFEKQIDHAVKRGFEAGKTALEVAAL